VNAPARDLNAHLWERHPDDWYVEEEWCDTRLFEEVAFEGPILDPACGLGRIVRAAKLAGLVATGHDKVGRSEFCKREGDFLQPWPLEYRPSSIVSNPPFGISQQFVSQALCVATHRVAMLLPTKWLSGDKRSRWLSTTPLERVLFLTPRPSMPPGPVIEAGIQPGGGTADFCWILWNHRHFSAPTFGWLRRDRAEAA
jgi:hypothetical protein